MKINIDIGAALCYNTLRSEKRIRGCSSMVEHQPSKLDT